MGETNEVTDEELAQLAPTDPTVLRILARMRKAETLLKMTVTDVAKRHAMAMEQGSRADRASEALEAIKRENAELRADVAAAEHYSRGLNNAIETKNTVNASLRVELTEIRIKYDELKLHLEMYKDQWKRHWESEKEKLTRKAEDEQAQWFHDHLNDEVKDAEEERDEAIAVAAQQRVALENIVKTCSWTREEHDPLVGVGLTANAALAHDVGEGWVSPKKHARVLEELSAKHTRALAELRTKLEKAAVTSLANIDDQLRVSSSMRALPLEGQ